MTVIRSDKTESRWTGVLLSSKASQFPRFCAQHSQTALQLEVPNISEHSATTLPSFLSYSHKFLGFFRGFVNFSFFLIPFLKVFFVFFFERLLYFSAKEKETYQMVRHFAEDSEFCVDFFSLIALKNLMPPSQPIRCKSYANCTFNQSPFPRVRQFLCFFLRVLIGFFVLICNCDLLGFPLKKHNESIFCFYKA